MNLDYEVLLEEEAALTLVYMRLSAALALEWEENPKLHDLPAIGHSIVRYGFQDPPRLVNALNNGRGGLVEGNGRLQALADLCAAGQSPPANIGRLPDGEWAVPVLVGNDGFSLALARAYAIDHNHLTLLGGDLSLPDLARIWDAQLYGQLLEQIQAEMSAEALPVTLAVDEVARLLGQSTPPPQGKWTPIEAAHKTRPGAPNTTCSIGGRLYFTVERADYLRWREAVRQAIGFAPAAVLAEMARRLGLPGADVLEEMDDSA